MVDHFRVALLSPPLPGIGRPPQVRPSASIPTPTAIQQRCLRLNVVGSETTQAPSARSLTHPPQASAPQATSRVAHPRAPAARAGGIQPSLVLALYRACR